MFLERSEVSYFTYFEVTVLQDMIDELAVTGGCYGNGNERRKKTESNENLKANVPSTDYNRSNTTGERRMF
jgi:hypothetical protein